MNSRKNHCPMAVSTICSFVMSSHLPLFIDRSWQLKHFWMFSPNGGLVMEIPWFQGTPGWWNIIDRWWQLKHFWNFHPDPWGNDPIWRAYFSNGWLKHQLVYQPLAFSTFIHYLSTHHYQPTIIFNGFLCPTILLPENFSKCFKPSRFAMHVLVIFWWL